MQQAVKQFTVTTKGKGLYEFTGQTASWVQDQKIRTGLLTLFIRHTSASLTIQENADPDVIADLNDFFSRLAPEGDHRYRHTAEGPDDMPAHIRAALTMTQLSVPVVDGLMGLGTWQGIYVFEHRAQSHRRNVLVHLIGE